MFSAQTYTGRRTGLKNKVEKGIAIFIGNDESPMNYADNTYHFRQDSSFIYYFAMQHPGLVGVVDFDEGKDYIFGNDLSIDDIVWMGTQPSIAERAKASGIQHTGSMSDFEAFINKAKSSGRQIHFLPPYRPENKIKLWNWLGLNPNEVASKASVELIQAVVSQREIKSAEEIAEIEKAVNTSVDMHVAAMRMVRPGMKESEVAARVQEIALAAGGNISFPVIATIHGETLHNHYHGNTLKSGDLFLLDCGAETEMRYAGDLSSTFPVDKTFTAQQKEIYEVTLASHEASIKAMKPGIAFKDVYYASAREIVNGMKALGFMKGDTEEALQAGAHAMFFQCGLGHMMGLDVHDMEDLGEVYVGYNGKPKSTQFGIKSLRLAKPLQPGHVVTIEPGIYFIPELIDMWKAEKRFREFINFDKMEEYKHFGGIRNEEDFVITENGYRLLGKQKPKTIEQVEAERK